MRALAGRAGAGGGSTLGLVFFPFLLALLVASARSPLALSELLSGTTRETLIFFGLLGACAGNRSITVMGSRLANHALAGAGGGLFLLLMLIPVKGVVPLGAAFEHWELAVLVIPPCCVALMGVLAVLFRGNAEGFARLGVLALYAWVVDVPLMLLVFFGSLGAISGSVFVIVLKASLVLFGYLFLAIAGLADLLNVAQAGESR